MKILKSEPMVGVQVITDEGECDTYTRYGPDVWFVAVGESMEPVYICEELEAEYQRHLLEGKDGS